jgi:hypothetical protein
LAHCADLVTAFTDISSATALGLGLANPWHPRMVSATASCKDEAPEIFHWMLNQEFGPTTECSDAVLSGSYPEKHIPPDLEMGDIFEAGRFLADVAAGKAVIGLVDMY